MRLRWIGTALALCMALPAAAATQVLVVAGLGGEPQYEEHFAKWSEQVAHASLTITGDAARVQRLAGNDARRENIQAALRAAAQGLHAGDHFVLVLIGHGSFDGTEYRFNIPGDDITGTEIRALLDRFPEGVTQLLVDATSTSGAVADKWAGPHRIVITATRTGGERNATRFAGYWAEALGSSEADRDKDGNVTAQEAFDYATRKVTESFKEDASIATEHARIGGEDAGRFVVARLGAAALYASDAQLAALRTEQDGIEQRLDQLRAQKAALSADDYYNKLEPVLVDMAHLGQRIDARLAQLGVKTGGGNAVF
ncbi:MAG TPA: hypothetical protein VMH77_08355 [Steroidobacteraceae bacterium]|nr:hypothetical protein [Steroidobacteraceae bacterium]